MHNGQELANLYSIRCNLPKKYSISLLKKELCA
jgi:hypothetical protein